MNEDQTVCFMETAKFTTLQMYMASFFVCLLPINKYLPMMHSVLNYQTSSLLVISYLQKIPPHS